MAGLQVDSLGPAAGKVEWVSRVEFLKEMLQASLALGFPFPAAHGPSDPGDLWMTQGPLELPKFVHDHDRLLEEQPLADYMIYSTKEAIAHGTGIGGQQTMY